MLKTGNIYYHKSLNQNITITNQCTKEGIKLVSYCLLDGSTNTCLLSVLVKNL